MRLRVDVIPGEHLAYPDVVLVVDVIRATTTAAAFLGLSAIALTTKRGPVLDAKPGERPRLQGRGRGPGRGNGGAEAAPV